MFEPSSLSITTYHFLAAISIILFVRLTYLAHVQGTAKAEQTGCPAIGNARPAPCLLRDGAIGDYYSCSLTGRTHFLEDAVDENNRSERQRVIDETLAKQSGEVPAMWSSDCDAELDAYNRHVWFAFFTSVSTIFYSFHLLYRFFTGHMWNSDVKPTIRELHGDLIFRESMLTLMFLGVAAQEGLKTEYGICFISIIAAIVQSLHFIVTNLRFERSIPLLGASMPESIA